MECAVCFSHAGWSSVVQLGVIDCSNRQSLPTCSAYEIRGYPTMQVSDGGEREGV